jgi:hypothetical protein
MKTSRQMVTDLLQGISKNGFFPLTCASLGRDVE